LKQVYTIPLNTIVELVAIKNNKAYKKVMSYEDALNINKKKGWYYYIYQLGFSQF